MASAIAATAVPGLVMARGHRIDDVRELPIVVSDDAQGIVKTKVAKNLLTQLGCKADMDRTEASRHIRKGKGKWRNRRYVTRRGPLLVYAKSNGCHTAFRGIPGMDMLNVEALNLMKVAPGGTLGRLVIWTESAFKKLDELFGGYESGSSSYKEYTLPRPVMTNADLGRIINSTEIQTSLNPAKEAPKAPMHAKNPLVNKKHMSKLNPAAPAMRKRTRNQCTAGKSENIFAAEKRQKTMPDVIAVRKLKKTALSAEYKELASKIAEAAAAASKNSVIDDDE